MKTTLFLSLFLSQALSYLADVYDLNEEEKASVSSLQISLHLNVALCCLKVKRWEQVVHNCDKAIQMTQDNPKVCFYLLFIMFGVCLILSLSFFLSLFLSFFLSLGLFQKRNSFVSFEKIRKECSRFAKGLCCVYYYYCVIGEVLSF